MPSEVDHHASGSLQLAVALAATAGFVDAFIYERVAPVFVANMSGNLIRLGISAGHHHGTGTVIAVVALAGFVAGVIIGAAHLDVHVRSERPIDPSMLLLSEAVMLAALPVILRVAHVAYSPSIQPVDHLVIAVGSVAMGLQAVALRRVGQIAVSTTYGTGAVVRLGEKLALAAKRTPRPQNHRRRTSIAVIGTVLCSYVGGAFIAASLSGNPTLLLIPATIPLVGSVGLRHQRRRTNALAHAKFDRPGTVNHRKRVKIKKSNR